MDTKYMKRLNSKVLFIFGVHILNTLQAIIKLMILHGMGTMYFKIKALVFLWHKLIYEEIVYCSTSFGPLIVVQVQHLFPLSFPPLLEPVCVKWNHFSTGELLVQLPDAVLVKAEHLWLLSGHTAVLRLEHVNVLLVDGVVEQFDLVIKIHHHVEFVLEVIAQMSLVAREPHVLWW